jgi:probable F420-dependent oxidoreductase
MTAPARPDGVGLWAGFLDRLPAQRAVEAVGELERLGVGTIWLQEFSGVDPFVRASLYLAASDRLEVCLGVATIHARDPEAMVAASSTLEEAFPGRFCLGLGVSHAHLVSARGGSYSSPIEVMRNYVAAMDLAAGPRRLPLRFLGALGPRMVALGGSATDGVHSYFSPVAHTAEARASVGPRAWVAPTQMVALGATTAGWRDAVRPYFGLCLGMDNYRRSLRRFGFGDAHLDAVSDDLVDALVVPDRKGEVSDRLEAQREAGADHVVIQLVPPPGAEAVVERVAEGLDGLSL